MKKYAILIDSTYCTGCNTCLYKCVQENRLHEPASRGLFRTYAEITDGGLYHRRCMHCKEPVCVQECPAGALKKSEYGAVLYDPEVCVGCKTCVEACPFHVPQFDPATQKIVKCSMCAHRIGEGRQPACAEACPTEALMFGEYGKIAALAEKTASQRRLRLYGAKENGGTHLFVLSKGDPLNAGYPKVASISNAEDFLPGMAALAIGGLKLFSDRRARIEADEGK